MDAILEKILIPLVGQVPALAVVAWIIFQQNKRDLKIAEVQRQVAVEDSEATKAIVASFADAVKSMAASYTDATNVQTEAMNEGLKTVLTAMTHNGGRP